jgi:signal transduction histidine kinase
MMVRRQPADPRFEKPLSGLYWQVEGRQGELLRSTSLWDSKLTVPDDQPAVGELHQHEIDGPAGGRLFVVERLVQVTRKGELKPARVAVGADLARVSKAASNFSFDLIVALGLLSLVLGAATSVQVGLGLAPLSVLRRRVAEIRRGVRHQIPAEAPREVASLVDELNQLITAQEREIERSRGRAADLAHGLKTPLAALSTDVDRLRDLGQARIADDIEQVGDTMSRHVDRELARARAQSSAGRRSLKPTELKPLVASLTATLSRAQPDSAIAFEVRIAPDMGVAMDRTDLAEVLGNLLENAVRHANRRIVVSAVERGSATTVTIEDDGPGIPEAERAVMLRRGQRLDMRGDGAGLGLAIVQDVLEMYGWRLELNISELGGLKATICSGDAEMGV